MKHPSKEFYLFQLLSFFLGALCTYLYFPLEGFRFAFLMDQEFYIELQRKIFDFGILFKLFHFFQDTLSLLIVCFPVLYLPSEKLRKEFPYSIAFFLAGTVIIDFYYCITFPLKNFPLVDAPALSSSIFFNNNILSYLFNLFVWGTIFYLSIIIGTKIKSKLTTQKTHNEKG